MRDILVNALVAKYKVPIILGVLGAFLLLMLVGIIFGFSIMMMQPKSSGEWSYEISEVGENEIPPEFIPIYHAASEEYGVPWNLLAAHHKVETNFSRIDPMRSPVGAVGHMQFMPCTFVGWSFPGCGGVGALPDAANYRDPAMIKKYRGYGVDANKDGISDPFQIEDAIFSAANYLSANGASSGDINRAILAYNRSQAYLKEVLMYADMYVSQGFMNGAQGEFVWPVPFTRNITSHFGMRVNPTSGIYKLHAGFDVAAAGIGGKQIVSVAKGTVISSGYNGGYGYQVVINHGKGIVTSYSHMIRKGIAAGKNVKAGQPIGAVGTTGDSTGNHLHFEVRVNGKPVDPINYFQ